MIEVGLSNWVMRPLLTLECTRDVILGFERMWCKILSSDLNTYSPIQIVDERKQYVKKYNVDYYHNNKEDIREKNVEYRQNNKEVIRQKNAEYYQDNKEVISQKKAEYYHSIENEQ